MKTKILILFLSSILVFCKANSQSKKIDDFLNLDTILYFNNITSSQGLISQEIKYCFDQMFFYFTDYNFTAYESHHNTFKVYSINGNTKHIDTIIFNLPNNNKFLYPAYTKVSYFNCNYPYFNFYIDGKYILFKYDSVNKKSELIYQWEHDFFGVTYCSILNNKLIFEGDLIYPNCLANISILSLMNHDDKKAGINPKFDMPEFSYLAPNNWMHTNIKGDKILFAQTTKYKIEIFDTLLNTTSIIEKKSSEWIDISDKYRSKIEKYAKSYNFQQMAYLDTLYSRLQGAWFIGDSMLLVQYVHPQPYSSFKAKLIYDVWKINNNGEWTILHNYIIDKKPDDNLILSKDSYPFYSFKNHNFIFSDKKLIVITSGDNINPIGLTWKEYKKETKNWYENNSAMLKIAIFSYSF